MAVGLTERPLLVDGRLPKSVAESRCEVDARVRAEDQEVVGDIYAAHSIRDSGAHLRPVTKKVVWPEKRMSVLVRAFPLRRPVNEVRAFAAALTERKDETAAFYRQFGISYESFHVQETRDGAWGIAVTVIDDAPEAAQRYAKSSVEFDSWFKEQILHLTGVNPAEQPLGPPTTQVFAWVDDQRPSIDLS
jgi:hypothetical protein